MLSFCAFRSNICCTAMAGCARCCWFASNTFVSGDCPVCKHHFSKTCAGRPNQNLSQVSNPVLFPDLMRKETHRCFLVQTKDCCLNCTRNTSQTKIASLRTCMHFVVRSTLRLQTNTSASKLRRVQRFVHCGTSSASCITVRPALQRTSVCSALCAWPYRRSSTEHVHIVQD